LADVRNVLSSRADITFREDQVLEDAQLSTSPPAGDYSLHDKYAALRHVNYSGKGLPPYYYYGAGYRLHFSYRTAQFGSTVEMFCYNNTQHTQKLRLLNVEPVHDGAWHTVDVSMDDISLSLGFSSFWTCASLQNVAGTVQGVLLGFQVSGVVEIDSLFFYTYDYLVHEIRLPWISEAVEQGRPLGTIEVVSKLPYKSSPVLDAIKLTCTPALPALTLHETVVSTGGYYGADLANNLDVNYRVTLPNPEGGKNGDVVNESSFTLKPRTKYSDGLAGHSFRAFWMDDLTYAALATVGSTEDLRLNILAGRRVYTPSGYLAVNGKFLSLLRTDNATSEGAAIRFEYPMQPLTGDIDDWYFHASVKTKADVSYTIIIREGTGMRFITIGNCLGAGGVLPQMDFVHDGSSQIFHIPLSSFLTGTPPVVPSGNASLTIIPVGDKVGDLLEFEEIYLARNHVEPEKITIQVRGNDGRVLPYKSLGLWENGEALHLSSVLTPGESQVGHVTWTCADNSVVTLSDTQDGQTLQARQHGSTYVTVSCDLLDGSKLYDTLWVYVRMDLVQEMSLYQGAGAGQLVTHKSNGKADTTLYYTPNSTFRLQAHAYPYDVSKRGVVWSIDTPEGGTAAATFLTPQGTDGDSIRTVQLLPHSKGHEIIVRARTADGGPAAVWYRIAVLPDTILLVDSDGKQQYTPGAAGKNFEMKDITLKVVCGDGESKVTLPVRWSYSPEVAEAVAFTDGIASGSIAPAERTVRILRPNTLVVIQVTVEGLGYPFGQPLTGYYSITVPESELNIVRVDAYALANKANPGDIIKLIAEEPHAGAEVQGGMDAMSEHFVWEASEGLTCIYKDTAALYKSVHYRVDTAAAHVRVKVYRPWLSGRPAAEQPQGEMTLEILPRITSYPAPPTELPSEQEPENSAIEGSAVEGSAVEGSEVVTPVTPVVTPPVTPVTPVVTPPVTPVVTPPVTPVVTPPVTPVVTPVTPVVTPPVTPVVTPPVTTPVTPAESSQQTAVDAVAAVASPAVSYREGILTLTNFGESTVVITSLTGRLLASFTVSGESIHRPVSLPTGIYIAYTWPSQKVILKFVVQ
jgi:hypothetical protein